MHRRSLVRPSIAAACAAILLTACGGGGGGGAGSSAPDPTLVLTLANRDAVARAVGAAVLASPADDIGIAFPAAAARAASLRIARVARKHALAVEQETIACSGGGRAVISADDRDGDGEPSPNDIVSLDFQACREGGDTLDGTMTITLASIGGGGDSFSAGVSAAMSVVLASGERAEIDGAMRLSVALESPDRIVIATSVDGEVRLRFTTATFSDTIRLFDGYAERITDDAAVAPPQGNASFGRVRATVAGTLESARAGGIFDIATDVPLDHYTDDANPRRGTLHVLGASGQMRLTALNADTVRIELDANGDGSYENLAEVDWDWF